MSDYRHALANPNEVLKRQHFYASVASQGDAIRKVYDIAINKKLSQLKEANSLADKIAASPPKEDTQKALSHYWETNVLSQVPKRTHYDDVFWCCLLYLLDAKSVPQCSIGGPLHQFIYKVYDDFNPEDVL